MRDLNDRAVKYLSLNKCKTMTLFYYLQGKDIVGTDDRELWVERFYPRGQGFKAPSFTAF